MYGTELLRSRRCAPPRDRGVQPRRVLSNRESAASTSGGLGRNPEGLAAALREILSDPTSVLRCRDGFLQGGVGRLRSTCEASEAEEVLSAGRVGAPIGGRVPEERTDDGRAPGELDGFAGHGRLKVLAYVVGSGIEPVVGRCRSDAGAVRWRPVLGGPDLHVGKAEGAQDALETGRRGGDLMPRVPRLTVTGRHRIGVGMVPDGVHQRQSTLPGYGG